MHSTSHPCLSQTTACRPRTRWGWARRAEEWESWVEPRRTTERCAREGEQPAQRCAGGKEECGKNSARMRRHLEEAFWGILVTPLQPTSLPAPPQFLFCRVRHRRQDVPQRPRPLCIFALPPPVPVPQGQTAKLRGAQKMIFLVPYSFLSFRCSRPLRLALSLSRVSFSFHVKKENHSHTHTHMHTHACSLALTLKPSHSVSMGCAPEVPSVPHPPSLVISSTCSSGGSGQRTYMLNSLRSIKGELLQYTAESQAAWAPCKAHCSLLWGIVQ